MSLDSSAFDYSEDVKTQPTNETFAQLNAQVTEFIAAKRQVADLEDALEQAKQRFKNVSEVVLPEMMAEMGLSSIKTADGLDVTLEDDVHAHISEERNAQAIEWLDNHGQGALVTRQFVVKFGREQEALARKFAADLKKRKIQLDIAAVRKVHPQTLKAFVKRALAEGEDLPMDTFGVHRRTVAKIATSRA